MSTAEATQVRERLETLVEQVERDHQVVTTFSVRLTELARATRDLAGAVESGFARVDERFNRVDERFARIDERFARVDERFAQIDERFAQVDRRFDRIEKELGLLHDGVRRIDARMEQLVGYIIQDEHGKASSG